ncbi:MAG: polysaccharide biosynthesis tyrosine autokinase [Chloroflexi bacterium]|nr:polysaccharide biosynthesis tyrosine autokinase [Chloroflexota bacterium]
MDSSTNKYLKAVLKYLWLVILAAAVAGAATYFLRSRQQAYYASHVRIFIGSVITSPDPSIQQINTGAALALTYAQLITFDVMDTVRTNLSLPITTQELSYTVSASVVPETPILQISVTYTTPEAAAEIANEIAQVLIESSPSELTDAQQESLDSLRAQIDDVNRQIDLTNRQAEDAYSRLNAATEDADEEQIVALTAEYNRSVDQLNSSRAILAQLSQSFLLLANRTNRLEIIEAARPEPEPIGLRPMVVGAAGAVVGAMLAVAGILFLEFSNTSVRTVEDVDDLIDVPVLGSITNTVKIKRNKPSYLVTTAFPRARVTEDFRNVRINLLSTRKELGQDARCSVFLMTSAESRAGKTFITTNLAVSMAMSGMRVLLIDADLHRSTVDQVFELNNHIGLSTLISNANPEKPQNNKGRKTTPEQALQKTKINGLMVMTSGESPTHSTEILGSQEMAHLVKELQQRNQFDVILIDTPPCLVLADASAVAVATAASVVLVVELGRTRRDAALKAHAQFEQIGSEISGVIVNRNREFRQPYGKTDYYRS